MATDATNGHNHIGPYFFVANMSSMQIQSLVERVILAYSTVCNVVSLTFDGLTSHIKVLENIRLGYDTFRTFLGPLVIFDPVHTIGIIWRLLVTKNIQINDNVCLNKNILEEIYKKEMNEDLKERYNIFFFLSSYQ